MPKKKRVLFINYSLHSGGVEKSLVTILSLFDYSRYEVDLQLFLDEGLFLSRVPPQVRLLPPLFPAEYGGNIRRAFPALLRGGHPLLALGRLLVSFAGLRGTMGRRLAKMWKVERLFLRPARRRYDAAVAFMEGQPLYYNVTKVESDVKIGFIHGDYGAMGLCREYDLPFIGKLDFLCTVSESCLSALKRAFPGYAGRCRLIYNILSAGFLRSLAEEGPGYADGFDGPRVLSIARLSHQKGLDIALPAVAALLRRGGLSFRWYIIGVGPEEEKLRKTAEQLGVREQVVFLGERANPYPFLKDCDVYLQPSRFEGKAIAVDEAKALCRPILLTAFSTAADQISSGENGLIVPMTPEGVENGLHRLLTDSALRERFSAALAREDPSNEGEIEKLYALMDGRGTAEQ